MANKLTLSIVYDHLDRATQAANLATLETGRYWTAIHSDKVNGWIISDCYHPR